MMNSQQLFALSSKLNSVDETRKAHLISYLPSKLQELLQSEVIPTHIIPLQLTVEKLQRRIHASHFKSYLDTLSEGDRQFFIAAFPKEKRKELSLSHLEIEEFKTKKFSEEVLLILLGKALSNFPPKTFLPAHPAAELLQDVETPLSKVIRFLGLFDVAIETSRIISKQTLSLLQQQFTKEEIDFINKILAEEEIHPLYSMNLVTFKGSEGEKEQLDRYIEERGLIRLSRALNPVPSEYQFLFTYFLPKELSDKIAKLQTEKQKKSYCKTNWLENTLTTWRFLCTYSQ